MEKSHTSLLGKQGFGLCAQTGRRQRRPRGAWDSGGPACPGGGEHAWGCGRRRGAHPRAAGRVGSRVTDGTRALDARRARQCSLGAFRAAAAPWRFEPAATHPAALGVRAPSVPGAKARLPRRLLPLFFAADRRPGAPAGNPGRRCSARRHRAPSPEPWGAAELGVLGETFPRRAEQRASRGDSSSESPLGGPLGQVSSISQRGSWGGAGPCWATPATRFSSSFLGPLVAVSHGGAPRGGARPSCNPSTASSALTSPPGAPTWEPPRPPRRRLSCPAGVPEGPPRVSGSQRSLYESGLSLLVK